MGASAGSPVRGFRYWASGDWVVSVGWVEASVVFSVGAVVVSVEGSVGSGVFAQAVSSSITASIRATILFMTCFPFLLG